MTSSRVKAFKKLHRRACPRPHVYMYTLGVDPALQNQAVGDKVIIYVLNIAAETLNLPTYFECTGLKLNHYYAKRDFDIVGAVMMRIKTESGERE